MIRALNYRWVRELTQMAKLEELPPKIAELAEVIGTEAAIKAYIFYSPIPTTFPEYPITELKKLYIQKKFGELSVRDLSNELEVSPNFVYKIINAPANKGGGIQIPMFD